MIAVPLVPRRGDVDLDLRPRQQVLDYPQGDVGAGTRASGKSGIGSPFRTRFMQISSSVELPPRK